MSPTLLAHLAAGPRTPRWARIAVAAALGIGLLATTVIATAPAEASTPLAHAIDAAPAGHTQLEIAIGDSAFAPISTRSLFSGDNRLVPGSSRTASFKVRNASSDASLLSLALSGASSGSPILLTSVMVDAVVPGSTPVKTHLSDGSACRALLDNVPLAAGAQLLVTVSVSLMASLTGTTAQSEQAAFDFVAGLSDAAAGAQSVSHLCTGGSTKPAVQPVTRHPHPGIGPLIPPLPGTPLADTGSNVMPYLMLGSMLVGAGAVLLVARRRRDRHTEGKPSEG